MAFKYKTVDTSTVEGLKRAERLVARGWKIISVGFWQLILEKEVKKKEVKK